MPRTRLFYSSIFVSLKGYEEVNDIQVDGGCARVGWELKRGVRDQKSSDQDCVIDSCCGCSRSLRRPINFNYLR